MNELREWHFRVAKTGPKLGRGRRHPGPVLVPWLRVSGPAAIAM